MPGSAPSWRCRVVLSCSSPGSSTISGRWATGVTSASTTRFARTVAVDLRHEGCVGRGRDEPATPRAHLGPSLRGRGPSPGALPVDGCRAPFSWSLLHGMRRSLHSPGVALERRRRPRFSTRACWFVRGAAFLFDFLLMAIFPFSFFFLFGVSTLFTTIPNPPISAVSWVWFWCLAGLVHRVRRLPGLVHRAPRSDAWDEAGGDSPLSDRRRGESRSTQLCRAPGAAPSRRRPAGSSSSLWILDYLWPLGDTRRQCIHDKIAHTVAVDLRAECDRARGSAERPANDRPSRRVAPYGDGGPTSAASRFGAVRQ